MNLSKMLSGDLRKAHKKLSAALSGSGKLDYENKTITVSVGDIKGSIKSFDSQLNETKLNGIKNSVLNALIGNEGNEGNKGVVDLLGKSVFSRGKSNFKNIADTVKKVPKVEDFYKLRDDTNFMENLNSYLELLNRKPPENLIEKDKALVCLLLLYYLNKESAAAPTSAKAQVPAPASSIKAQVPAPAQIPPQAPTKAASELNPVKGPEQELKPDILSDKEWNTVLNIQKNSEVIGRLQSKAQVDQTTTINKWINETIGTTYAQNIIGIMRGEENNCIYRYTFYGLANLVREQLYFSLDNTKIEDKNCNQSIIIIGILKNMSDYWNLPSEQLVNKIKASKMLICHLTASLIRNVFLKNQQNRQIIAPLNELIKLIEKYFDNPSTGQQISSLVYSILLNLPSEDKWKLQRIYEIIFDMSRIINDPRNQSLKQQMNLLNSVNKRLDDLGKYISNYERRSKISLKIIPGYEWNKILNLEPKQEEMLNSRTCENQTIGDWIRSSNVYCSSDLAHFISSHYNNKINGYTFYGLANSIRKIVYNIYEVLIEKPGKVTVTTPKGEKFDIKNSVKEVLKANAVKWNNSPVPKK